MDSAIRDDKGRIICSANQKIDVDCCQKVVGLRPVAIYWDDNTPIPPEFSYKDLQEYSEDGGLLFTRAEERGSCIPMDWTLRGFGKLDEIGEYADKAAYTPPGAGESPDCTEHLYISVHDRCGTDYTIHAPPCCLTFTEPVEIIYTTLYMTCNQNQDLMAHGGCGPYHWSLSGGAGTLSPTEGMLVKYVAPATNPNCTSNPTITLTDCCGNSTSISIAVNCYTYNDLALCVDGFDICSPSPYINIGGLCMGGLNSWWKQYRCDGVMLGSSETGCVEAWQRWAADCHEIDGEADCIASFYGGWECPCSDNPPCGPWLGCVGTHDKRSAAMKAAGCCPINPITGLPF